MRALKFSGALLAGATALWLMGSTATSADTIVGSESATAGFTGELFAGTAFANSTGYVVASDGESAFQPFGATFDTSDGIDLSQNGFVWTQADDSFWTQLGAAAPVQTWVLPASTTCGTENESECEFVGHFLSPVVWNPGVLGTYDILDAEGGLSDVIILDNNAAGQAELWFYSDPTFPAPEPITLSLFGAGLAGSVALRRRKKKIA